MGELTVAQSTQANATSGIRASEVAILICGLVTQTATMGRSRVLRSARREIHRSELVRCEGVNMFSVLCTLPRYGYRLPLVARP